MFRSVVSCLALGLGCLGAAAQPLNESAIPPPLKEWRAWALKDLDYRACPFLANSAADSPGNFVCAWPGRLSLTTGADGATFSMRWRVEAHSRVPLPGDAEHWPQQVTVNGQRQPVLERARVPELLLASGTYEIAGRIPWRERPQALGVPAAIGLIALTVDGKAIAPIQRDGARLTLGRSAAKAPEADNVQMRIYRKLRDGVPAQLTTQLAIAVSGQAREETLGPVLPDGYVPLSLEGAWPARLDSDGRMHVQVQPGFEILTLEARATAPLTAQAAQLPAAPWPKQEIWSYEAAPQLRITAVSGAVQVDPRQANVPDAWHALPAYALADGAKLIIEERSRGLAPDEGNRLTLQREAWLDFDGDGWYARDRLGGTMARGWRFDVAAPFALEQATALNSRLDDEDGEPLLITRDAQRPGLSGVEWRTPHVDLAAGVRVAAAASLSVAGWQDTFDSVQATLHFPFGYKLLAAPGADAASGSWIGEWSLLDVFVCAIAVLLGWRLLGIAGAAAVAGYLLLAYRESGSPLWSLLGLLAVTLIARSLPAGRLQGAARLLRRIAQVALVLVALPFIAAQVRGALHPQLEQGAYASAAGWEFAAGGAAGRHKDVKIKSQMRAETARLAAPAAPPEVDKTQQATVAEEPARNGAAKPPLETIVVTGSKIDRSQLIDHYAETTVVQTGAGAPDWQVGSVAQLTWSGPVPAAQTVRLVIAPPWLLRSLRIVLVLLLAWLLVRLLRFVPAIRPGSGANLGIGVLMLCSVFATPPAQAQAYPSDSLLAQLRQRLSVAPPCAPACASIAQAQVVASGDSVSVALEVHAAERIVLPLPDDPNATLKNVQVDGNSDDAIARSDKGVAAIALGRGVHRVQLEFAAAGDKVALAFPQQPERLLFEGRGWEASGLADDRLLTETLTLLRAHEGSGAMSTGSQQFPAYVQVTRTLSLGLEWSVWTRVERLAPKTGGFSIAVPVIAGEHVTAAGRRVVDGRIEAAIADGDDATTWDSNLDKSAALTLSAPPLSDRAEIWRVVVSPTWHVEFSGVPGVGIEQSEDVDDYHAFEFHPLPGETLTLAVTRPEPAQGAQRAIDGVGVNSAAGQHASQHELSFRLRASQGGDQVITLPSDAQVLAVTRDEQTLNLRARDGKLTLPVVPGAHRYLVRFRDSEAIGLVQRTPALALGLPAANVGLLQQLPADRWVLAVFGPPVGPAVLYWGELVVMIALAWALSRTRRTRLLFRDWLLLGLGFSTFSWIALLAVVAWLFAFDWRARGKLPERYWHFDLVQIALALLTLVALLSLMSAIPQGLLGQPDMHVTGNGSQAYALRWFADRSSDALPIASAVSVPLWVYKVLMLAWAIWLANALIGWLRDAFGAWTQGGYWRGKPAAPNADGAPVLSAAAPVENV